MHIRTFQAADLYAALATIREQMGPEATILHTRNVSSGLWGMLGRQRVEVTAGLRSVEPSASERSVEPAASEVAVAKSQWAADTLSEALAAEGLPPRLAEQWLAATLDDPQYSQQPPAQLAARLGIVWQDDTNVDEADATLARLRLGLANWLCSQLRVIPSHGDPVNNPAGDSAGELGQRQRVIAVIGATGVGKTTTIAKLAANARLGAKAKVGLVTLDAFRAAAVEQLEAYAAAMRVPLAVIRSAHDVPAARAKLSDCEQIFVDTGGHSPRGSDQLRQLQQLLPLLQPDQTHLVLDANSSIAATRSCLQAFSSFQPSGVIISKTDEVLHPAGMLAAVLAAGLGLTYLTTGQQVPEDLRPAVAGEVASWASGLAVIGR
ncbi:hypothetical protein SH139x_000596 [Planctomycetaceae bacterium SH139]